jgi:hypothetical protein
MEDKSVIPAAIRKAFQSSDSPVQAGAFYIHSNIGNSNWVVAATTINGRQVVRLARKNGALGQLWLREDDPRGGCFLKSIGTGRVLQWNGRGVECTLVARDESLPQQLWVPSESGKWTVLYAVNWNQALNVLGNSWDQNNAIGLWEYSNGQPNELWQLNPEQGAITVESMTYDMARAVVSLNVPPALNASTAVNNKNGSLPMDTNVVLERRVTSSHRISYDETSTTMMRTLTTLGFSGGFDGIVKVEGQTAVETVTENKVSFNDTSMQSSTVKDTISVHVQVPARAQFEYAILVRYGRVDVPYTAVVSRALPGGGQERVSLNGIYTNVNMIQQEVVGHDITDGMPRRIVVEPPVARELEPA